MKNCVKQVDKTGYHLSSYLTKGRWCAYYHQIDEVLRSNPQSLLIIGNGDGIVQSILAPYIPTIHVVDIDPELGADYVVSVDNLTNSISRTYDAVLCCQVLEHLPYAQFSLCLSQLAAVTAHFCILSLPHRNNYFGVNITIFNKPHELSFRLDHATRNFKFDGQHYWELGIKECMPSRIESDINRYFIIERGYNVTEFGYHRFYILKKRD